VHAIVRRFQKNEYQLDLQRPRQPRPNARKLTPAQMEALTTPEILREQAHLNLLQRCVLIERQLRVVISTSTLRNAYKQMGVAFLKVHRGWYAA
jgi:transposase